MTAQYKVKPGDCITSIAFDHGFFPKTIWEHATNRELKTKRSDPNVLLEGDLVAIPDKQIKEVTKQDGKRHRFRRKGVPARFRLQLFQSDKVRARLPWRLVVDGVIHTGITDAQGVLEVVLPPDAQEGMLYIDDTHEEYQLKFGRLMPATDQRGIIQRLKNLGFLVSEVNVDDLRPALRKFQRHFKLPETGEVDDATRKKLEDVHDKVKEMPQPVPTDQTPGGSGAAAGDRSSPPPPSPV